MANWVWKHDGTIQCTGTAEITLNNMRKDLAEIVGDEHILNQEKREIMVISLCGAPTGVVNAYELDDSGLYALMHGFVGPNGFRRWLFSETSQKHFMSTGPETPFPLSARDLLCRDCPFPMKDDDIKARDRIESGAITDAIGQITSVLTAPASIRDLIGRELNVLKPGTSMNLDIRPRRVTIIVDSENKITDIQFG